MVRLDLLLLGPHTSLERILVGFHLPISAHAGLRGYGELTLRSSDMKRSSPIISPSFGKALANGIVPTSPVSTPVPPAFAATATAVSDGVMRDPLPVRTGDGASQSLTGPNGSMRFRDA
jgi:hypothetical protein